MDLRMKNKSGLFVILLIGCLLLLPAVAYSQVITVKAGLDTNRITIGDQVKFSIEIKKGRNVVINFPVFNDKLTNEIEIIKVSPIDSSWSKTEEKSVLRQELLLTAFDSGLYYIPPIKFTFSDEKISDTIQTSATYLEVYSFPLDTTGTIRDIKAIEKAPLGFREVLPYVLILLVIGGLIWFIFYYLKKKKKNEPVFGREKPVEPAHIIAIRELDRLKAEKVWQRGLIKEYYSRLTEIIRRYIESRFEIIAMEQTTDEILHEFEEQKNLSKDDFKLLKDMLILADFVKFAKADPLPDENEAHFENAYAFVNNTKFQPVVFDVENTVDNKSENVTV